MNQRPKIPMLGDVIAAWRQQQPHLRLGQYFMSTYSVEDEDYPELWEASETKAKAILMEMYARYHW